MVPRYRLIERRNRIRAFYCVDTKTGRRTSLGTNDRDAAEQIVLAKNQALRQPALNLQIARAYLAGSDPGVATRAWAMALDSLIATKKGSTRERWMRAAKDRALAPLLPKVIMESRAEDHPIDPLPLRHGRLAFTPKVVVWSLHQRHKCERLRLRAQMDSPPIPESLRQQLARLDQKRAAIAGMPTPALESLSGRLRVELTYASNAIEGNTLSLRETQLVVEEGLAPGPGKTLREVYEARNHFAAIKQIELWVTERRELTAGALLDLHQTVLRDITPDWAGRLRNAPVFIRGTRYVPPNAAHLAEKLDELIVWTAQSALHPVLIAAHTHFRFEALHPFFDSNGRTGRLLLNWQLLRAGFPLTIIQVEDRARYLDALEESHSGNLLPLETLVADAVERSLDLAAGKSAG